MANQEYFTTSDKVSKIRSITQNVCTPHRENRQDASLTTDPTFPHTPDVHYLNVTVVTSHSPNKGELGGLPPTPETQELQARGESGDLLSKEEIKDNPPNQYNRDFPSPTWPAGGQGPHPGQSTQSGQQGLPPPTGAGGGQGPHPGQSTQSGQQGLPPQQGQEGDKVPILDNPPNQDNRDFPPPPNRGRRGTSSTWSIARDKPHGVSGKQKPILYPFREGKINTRPINPKKSKKKIVECKCRRSLIGDGKSTVVQKVCRDAYISDLTWPMFKISEIEYLKRFTVQILEAMNMFHQGMARLSAWVNISKSKKKQ